MIVHLVRHGQAYNTHPVPDDPAPANPPLTPIGKAEAHLVAARLRSLGVDRLVSSPMIRTIETAQVIGSALSLSVEVWPRCYEVRARPGYRCAGARGLRSAYPDLILPADFAEDDWEYGNEPLESSVRRADEFLSCLEAQATRGAVRRLVVVTHGAFTRLVVGRILGADPERVVRVVIDNTSVTTLRASIDGFRVLGINDTAHLAETGDLDPVLGVTR